MKIFFTLSDGINFSSPYHKAVHTAPGLNKPLLTSNLVNLRLVNILFNCEDCAVIPSRQGPQQKHL